MLLLCFIVPGEKTETATLAETFVQMLVSSAHPRNETEMVHVPQRKPSWLDRFLHAMFSNDTNEAEDPVEKGKLDEVKVEDERDTTSGLLSYLLDFSFEKQFMSTFE